MAIPPYGPESCNLRALIVPRRTTVAEPNLDFFVQEATMTVADQWQKAGGRELTEEEIGQLNALLYDFFKPKVKD